MIRLLAGDCRDVLATLPADSVQCVVTSPPYYALRSYLDASHPDKHREIGSEPTPDDYLATMVAVFREVRRVLRPDGTCWVNMGDSYAGNTESNGRSHNVNAGASGNRAGAGERKQGIRVGAKPKDLLMMPARLALALQADGWWLRSAIVWHKPNPMPESVRDRPVNSYEHVFLLTKSARYFFDMDAVAEFAGGANGATLGSAALAPKPNAALDADNRAPHLHGRCNLGEPQIAVDCSVTWQAKHAEIVERIRFSVVVERAERSFVVDLEPSNGATLLAAVASALKRCATGNLPVRATIVDAASSERGASDTDTVGAVPLTETRLRAEPMLEPERMLTGMIEESAAAEVTLHFDELGEALSVLGTCRPAHRGHDSRNIPTRAIRNVWTIATAPYSEAHFATYPPALAERCIKAGTSERGCCSQCGKPWVRVVERGAEATTRAPASVYTGLAYASPQSAPRGPKRDFGESVSTTTGWRAGCDHNAPVVPCTVLDPFAGAGTTLLVADRLQRDAIGIELNTAYTEMAMQRCRDDAPLFVDAPAADPEDERIADLFAEAAE